MASAGGENLNTSQFYITMRDDDLEFLDGKHTIFGEVAEGLDTVLKDINELYCDTDGRPYRDVRILHTYILEDPFDDPAGLAELIPDASPLQDRPNEETVMPRLVDLVDEEDGLTASELEERIRETEAKKRAVVLEMIGDIPDAEIKPPENVLFVCKLNQITTDEDLEIIFSRFGNVKAEIIRDPVTGDSLNYAFVEFDDVESCEEAYKKMDNALIDDRRVKVDFSQSVAKIWNKYTMRPQGGKTKITSRGVGNPPVGAPSLGGPKDGGRPPASSSGDVQKHHHSRSSPPRGGSGRDRGRERERERERDRHHHRRERSRSRDRGASSSSGNKRRYNSRSRSRERRRDRSRDRDRDRRR